MKEISKFPTVCLTKEDNIICVECANIENKIEIKSAGPCTKTTNCFICKKEIRKDNQT